MLRYCIYILLSLLFSSSLWAQHHLCFVELDKTECTAISDSSAKAIHIRDHILDLRKKGYLEASIDSSSTSSDSTQLFVHKGQLYSELLITSHNLPQEYLDSNSRAIPLKRFHDLSKALIDHFETIGYPFATVYLRDVSTDSSRIRSELFFDKGMHTLYDSLVIVGNSKLSKTYLATYLDIIQHREYDERSIQDIDKQLRNLPLVKYNRPSRVQFFQGLSRVTLYIDDRITDQLDGVVGLAPNSESATGSDLLITGEVNIELNNLFHSARELKLHWRNYLQRSQLLDAGVTLPYLFNTKLGFNTSFNLNKYDTLFVNLNGKLGLRYQQQGNNYWQVYYAYNGSNLLNTDTSAVRFSGKLPSDNPFRIDNYGLTFHQRDMDYLPNPRKGYHFTADVAFGMRRLLQNTEIALVKFSHPDFTEPISLYDTLNDRSVRLKLFLQANYHVALGKRGTLVNSLTINSLFAENILHNEYYILGGFSSLQGFDENSIFASKYALYKIEYRYLFGKNSHIGLFANSAWVEDKINSKQDIPYGFGGSAQLEVGAGILRMAYALGTQQGNPISFQSGKIHFGLVNFF